MKGFIEFIGLIRFIEFIGIIRFIWFVGFGVYRVYRVQDEGLGFFIGSWEKLCT